MDQSWNRKFKVGTLAFAMVLMMTACSSSQVEEGDEVAESVADVSQDANTDMVPDIDPAVDGPVAEAPGLVADDPGAAPDAIASSGDQPPMGDPSMDMPAGDPNAMVADAPPMSDPGLVDPGIYSAPAPEGDVLASNSLDLPKDETLYTEPAPIAESGERDYLGSTTGDADTQSVDTQQFGKKKKKKKKHSSSRVAHHSTSTGDGVHYSVKRGDTLMKIAFENYGDLYRWKEIYEANRSVVQDPNSIPPGTQLVLNGAGMVQIERSGEQYMIHRGETLGSIAKNVYGSNRKWKKLWENNRELIKDPNKIYAGFYLYYQPEGKLTNGEPAAIEGEANNAPKQSAPVANVNNGNTGDMRAPASARQ